MKQKHFESNHIASLISRITFQKSERVRLFSSLEMNEQAAVFNDIAPAIQQQLLSELPPKNLAALLDHFDMHRAEQYLIRITNKRRRETISKIIKQDLHDKAIHFLRFHPKAAFDMMHFNYILLPHTKTIAEASQAVDAIYEETGKIPEVLVRKDGKCVGKIEPGVLIRESNTTVLDAYITPIVSINYKTGAKDVLHTLTTTGAKQLVVLDSDESVIGIIYAQDIFSLWGEHPTESLFEFAGVQEDELPHDNIMSKVRSRTRWLLLNLATVFLSAFIVAAFEHTLIEIVALSIYMPIIIGMGSNAGTQALAVSVRGITIGEVSLKNVWNAVRKEVAAVLIQSLIHSSIIMIITAALGHGFALGLVVSSAIIINLSVGVATGMFIPVFMRHIGKDPALASGVILTTLTDLSGLLALFGLATIFLL